MSVTKSKKIDPNKLRRKPLPKILMSELKPYSTGWLPDNPKVRAKVERANRAYIKQIACREEALFKHYGLNRSDPNFWQDLAWRLAVDFVPAFRFADSVGQLVEVKVPGRPRRSDDADRELIRAVEETRILRTVAKPTGPERVTRSEPISVVEACRQLCAKGDFQGLKATSIKARYDLIKRKNRTLFRDVCATLSKRK
jgi:hypothetical protein